MIPRCGRVAALSTGLLGSLALIALLQVFSFELSPDSGITSTQPLTMERLALSAPLEEKSPATRHFPSALLIGVRKGGTRALLDALALHPNIKAARREVHYFDDDKNYEKGEEWYLQQMPLSIDEITIEKTPAYFTNPSVPERVHRMNPAMKIIVIVREPITRAISDFTQVYYNRLSWNKSLPVFADLAFTKEGEIDMSYKPVRNSLYATHLSHWLKLFPLEQILVLDGDKFAKDPLSQLHLAESFLGLPHQIRADQLIFNPAKGFHCFRKSLTSKVKCLGRSKGRPHRDIDDKTQRHLATLFRPHNRAFFQMINRVFKW